NRNRFPVMRGILSTASDDFGIFRRRFDTAATRGAMLRRTPVGSPEPGFSVTNRRQAMKPTSESRTGRVVRGGEPYRSAQGAVYAPGISAETVDAQAVFLGIVTLAPGQRTKAHVHERHESAFYLLSGEEVELWSGEELEHRELARSEEHTSELQS